MTDVSIAELPEKLAEVLEEVRQGGTVAIKDGTKVVARMVPGGEIQFVQRADRSQPLGKYKLPPLGFTVDFDVVEALIEERNKDRQ